MLFSTLP